MLLKFYDWKNNWEEFSNIVNGKFEIKKYPTIGAAGSSYSVNVIIKFASNEIVISQNGGGSDEEVCLSYIEFKSVNRNLTSFNLSLYEKGFFERILNSNKIKTGNNFFDNKFGIYCKEKAIAMNLFCDNKVQSFFLNNRFLVFNIQRKPSLVTLRNMEVKIYEKTELMELLDNFVYILNIIQKSNP